jgi:arylsulfatase A-like enzyme
MNAGEYHEACIRCTADVWLAAIIAAFVAFPACAPPDAGPPNLLIISIDTLRADHVGSYGYGRKTTPALDRLAREGVLFENAVANSPWTLPSHASLFTGLYPRSHGLKSLDARLREDIPTLAERLRAEGYATCALYNSLYLRPHSGLLRGFAEHQYFPERVNDERVRSGSSQVDRAIDWLGQPRDRPFFLFLHNYDVHTKYDPSPSYLEMFARPYDGGIQGTLNELRSFREGERTLDEADLNRLIDLYDAGIRELDDQLGRLLDHLDMSGLAATTYVVVVSDHGEEFLDHGDVLHGRTMYEELLRVPLIVRGPGAPAGRRVGELAQLNDLFPTLLSLAGVEAGVPVEGVDLSPAWMGGSLDHQRMAYAEADHYNEEDDIKRMVRRGARKLIYDRLTRTPELYALDRDPLERKNIARENPGLVTELMGSLHEYVAGGRGEAERSPFDREQIEMLRGLGYVQ